MNKFVVILAQTTLTQANLVVGCTRARLEYPPRSDATDEQRENLGRALARKVGGGARSEQNGARGSSSRTAWRALVPAAECPRRGARCLS